MTGWQEQEYRKFRTKAPRKSTKTHIALVTGMIIAPLKTLHIPLLTSYLNYTHISHAEIPMDNPFGTVVTLSTNLAL